jgi:hypothetical protein
MYNSHDSSPLLLSHPPHRPAHSLAHLSQKVEAIWELSTARPARSWQFQKDPYSRDIGSKWRHRLLPAYRIRDRLGLRRHTRPDQAESHQNDSCFALIKTRGLSACRPTIAASLRR